MRALAGWSLGVALWLPACESPSRERRHVPGEVPSARPVDRLAEGELAEGLGDAFGLRLPRGIAIDRRYGDAVLASGQVPPEALVNYVRERVEANQVEIGAARTVFPKVRIRGGDPARLYRVEVQRDRGVTRLAVRDVTPPPGEPGLTEAERWQRAGLSPDGKSVAPEQNR